MTGAYYNRETMRLLFVADGRSPIAQNWIRHFTERGDTRSSPVDTRSSPADTRSTPRSGSVDEVYIASTFACSLDFPLSGFEVIPVAFSGFKNAAQHPGTAPARTVGLRTAIRQWFGPLTIRRAANQLRRFIERVKPDLVHAMRIPYEGMMAADAYNGTPLVVSTWGNDFTLHAPSTRLMSHYTRWAMQVADALHADCRRDARLAKQWGFEPGKPALVAPGNGGIRTDVFYPPETPVEEPVIINPRGFRPYVRNDVFFKAIPLVLAKRPDARFILSLMAGEPRAEQWIKEFRIDHAVELLPSMSHSKMAESFRRAQIVASPSIHDGTPNTLLEGIACGCFPIAGDLESIREWITPNENGLLFDSTDAQSIATAILTAIENKNLRANAAGLNQETIATRAEYEQNMQRAEKFYREVVK